MDKCIDMEGWSKQQNLRITGVKEEAEHGEAFRDFAAGLLEEVLSLEETQRFTDDFRNVQEMMNHLDTWC